MKKYINKFTFRVYDEVTLRNIEELQKTGAFDNLNDLLAKAVEIGTQTLIGRMSKAKALADGTAATKNYAAQLNAIEKELKDSTVAAQNNFIELRALEFMISTLYNIEAARIRGEEVSPELMDGGYFNDLPEMLKDILNDLSNDNNKN